MGENWRSRLGRGAIAGLSGGAAAVVVLWTFVEPALERAIALEDAGSASHSHGADASGHKHSQESGELVTRLQQQIGGTVTVLVVSVLLSLAFAVVYARTRHRFAGASDVSRSVALSGLAFFVLALVPAILVPANPPGLGDPTTVNTRTLIYLLALLLGVIMVGATFAVCAWLRARGGSATAVWSQTILAGACLLAAVFVLAPRASEPVPASMSSDLLWQFRSASLLQLAAMWLVMGLVLGLLEQRANRRDRVDAWQTTTSPAHV
jgi:predicted cobalt transporter CbtA